MKRITPAKRRLVIALAVAVKNYALLNRQAVDWFETAEHYRIGGIRVGRAEYKKIEKLHFAACDAIWDASIAFARRKKREGAFPQLGRYNAWQQTRFALAKRRFRRAAITIAKRGGIWNYDDEHSINLEERSQ